MTRNRGCVPWPFFLLFLHLKRAAKVPGPNEFMPDENAVEVTEKTGPPPVAPEKYNASNIIKHVGLEVVRKRPRMYIRAPYGRGLHLSVFEVLDNSNYEHLAG